MESSAPETSITPEAETITPSKVSSYECQYRLNDLIKQAKDLAEVLVSVDSIGATGNDVVDIILAEIRETVRQAGAYRDEIFEDFMDEETAEGEGA